MGLVHIVSGCVACKIIPDRVSVTGTVTVPVTALVRARGLRSRSRVRVKVGVRVGVRCYRRRLCRMQNYGAPDRVLVTVTVAVMVTVTALVRAWVYGQAPGAGSG